MAANNSPIPLIDLTTNPSVEELATQVLQAASTIGFLFLRLPQDGSLNQAKVNNMFEISKEFYCSPLEERLACPNDDDRNGYIGYRTSRLAESKGAGDLKESFTYGRHPESLPATRQPLPSVLKRRQAELDEFEAACWDLTGQLLDAFSVALNLPQTYFRERHARGCNGLTLINYPGIPAGKGADEAASTARASAHKDWGSLTLLFQEEHGTPGLEVFLADEVIRASQCKTSKPYELMSDVDLTQGKWHAAPIIPGTVLVNLGLALEAWTSGVLRATLHRVNVQPEPVHGGFRERKSMPYFVQPRDQVVLTPIKPDGTIEPVEGAKTSLEFYLDRIGATFKATEQQATAEVAVSA